MASGSSGVKTDAFANSGTAGNLSNNLTANAANVYGGLEPQLQAEAAAPSGYTPTQKAAMNTSAQQSAGGGNANAIGQGRLYAARTKNAGGAKEAIGAATRGSGENLSNAAVGTEVDNANLQQKQRQEGLQGEQSLYGTELGGGEQALGLSNQALGIANQAKPTFWQTMATDAASPIAAGIGNRIGGGFNQ
jgi:hypothetical protein